MYTKYKGTGKETTHGRNSALVPHSINSYSQNHNGSMQYQVKNA